MYPFKKRVLIKPLEDTSMTESGIEIPIDPETEKIVRGEVLEIGPEVISIKKGDNVVYTEYMCEHVNDLHVVDEDHILAKF